ncbi:MAG: cell division protein FtsL [bacterium]
MQAAQAISSARFRHTHAVTKVDRVKGVFVSYLIALILLAFVCSLFYIWSRIQIVNVGYEINRELSAKEKLIEESKRLSLEIATLKSPVRLEALAKNEYQMDLPRKSQVLSDETIRSLEVAEAPKAEKAAPAQKAPAKTGPAHAKKAEKTLPVKGVAAKGNASVPAKSQSAKKENLKSVAGKKAPEKAKATQAAKAKPAVKTSKNAVSAPLAKKGGAKSTTVAEITSHR